MTTLATVLTGPQSVFTTATTPAMGTINAYNANAGAIANTLPALSGLNVGASCIVEKYQLDGTHNTVTFTAAGADTFDDTTTSAVLILPGDKIQIQVITVGATKFWKRVDSASWPTLGAVAAIASQVSVTNTTTNTAIISATLPAGLLAAGSTFRAKLMGTVQVLATSGTLTFTPSIQGTALAQTAVMASQGVAGGPVGFMLDYLFTVRTTGSSGSAIATPWGQINLATPVILTSTSSSTTTVNTTAAAGSNVINVAAQWATASASNSLLVNTATLERIF